MLNQINKTNEVKEQLMDDLDCKSEAVRDLKNQHSDQESLLKEQIEALEKNKKSLENEVEELKARNDEKGTEISDL